MDKPNLRDAFEHFEKAVSHIEEAAPNLNLEQIITALTARDAVNIALSDKTQDPAEYIVSINKLDERLKKHFDLILKFDELTNLRSLLNPLPEAWWWILEPPKKSIWDRFDWLWEALTIPWLAVNLALIADISSRFITGTPDTISTFAIVFQSTLAAVAAGGALTKTGQDLVDGIFNNLKIPKRFWHETKLISAIVLSISLVALRTSLPSISLFYDKRGFESFKIGRIDDAKQDFIQAIKLNPNSMEANYNLGQIYESLQDSDNALIKYKIAAELGSVKAYSVIGRLYNLKKDYPLAAYFLLRGKGLLEKASKGSSIDKDVDTRYAILRNFGWARLEQERYSEAQAYLKDAIKLSPERVSAHCLMAQVLEKQKRKGNAKPFWKGCLKYSLKLPIDEYPIELDAWVNLANQALDSKPSSTSSKIK